MAKNDLLSIENLYLSYRIYKGTLKVLNNVNFEVRQGEKVGLVGETGCGKTTTMKAILRILPEQAIITGEKISFKGVDLINAYEEELQYIRRKEIAMIFQDPTSSLNPVFTIEDQLCDVIKFALIGNNRSLKKPNINLKDIAVQALHNASMPDPVRILSNYPFQLSGGMRQRVCIAMALATERNLLIADEPTTNLDVTIQDQVLRLIKRLVEGKNISLILITHSLGIVREYTDRVYIMYAGSMVEMAETKELFENALHPYTLGLFGSVPKLTGEGISQGIPGSLPDYLNPPRGCRFAPRCSKAMEVCQYGVPPFQEIVPRHYVSCFLYVRRQSNERNPCCQKTH